MNADRVVRLTRLILSTSFSRLSSMVIWIVFMPVEDTVYWGPHYNPHALLPKPKSRGSARPASVYIVKGHKRTCRARAWRQAFEFAKLFCQALFSMPGEGSSPSLFPPQSSTAAKSQAQKAMHKSLWNYTWFKRKTSFAIPESAAGLHAGDSRSGRAPIDSGT